MTSPPRPDLFIRICIGLFAAPVVVIVVAGATLFLTADEGIGGPAGLGAAFGLLFGLPLLVVEYYGIARCSRRATSFVAYLSLYFAALGSFAWIAGLIELLQLKSSGPDSMSPWDFAIYSAFLANLIAVGLGHLRWLRLLKDAQPTPTTQDR